MALEEEPSDAEASSAAQGPSQAEARAFGAAFRSFLEWVHSGAASAGAANEVTTLISGWLGVDGTNWSVVSRELPPFEHVNLQTAVNAWSHAAGRTVAVHGVVLPSHWGPISLQQLISGEGLPPLRLAAPALVDLPNGPSSTLACLKTGLLLVNDEAGRYVVLISGPSDHRQGLVVEIAGLPIEAAQAAHGELDRLRSRLNVYRGHVLDVGLSAMGGVGLTFAHLPATPRQAIVLPEAVLARVERHAFGIAQHRDQLLAAGQHLKRGLLLYGPPGTGKTHTTRYVVSRMAGYTRLLLTGRSLHVVGSVTELARELAPAVLVLEDVDLVAEDRSFGPGSSPVLFDLLDAMDGADADADLLFLLTTNRADLLETALAARPGRVDVAVEVGLPDIEARRQLLALYSAGVPVKWSDEDVEDVLDRTAGVTASFLKELVRRAVLESLHDASPLAWVTGDQLRRAVADLLDTSQQVTRNVLGVGGGPAGEPSEPGSAEGFGVARPWVAGRAGHVGGWVAYSPPRGRGVR